MMGQTGGKEELRLEYAQHGSGEDVPLCQS